MSWKPNTAEKGRLASSKTEEVIFLISCLLHSINQTTDVMWDSGAAFMRKTRDIFNKRHEIIRDDDYVIMAPLRLHPVLTVQPLRRWTVKLSGTGSVCHDCQERMLVNKLKKYRRMF